MNNRVALLDRDGTIIVERNYLSDPDAVDLLPNAADGLGLLRDMGFRLVIITNQSGIGRGYFSPQMVQAVHATLKQKLQAVGVVLDGIYICPHRPEDLCKCRKPEPGLVVQAAADLNFDLRKSVVIGDKPCDIGLARKIGALSVLVTTGYGAWYVQELKADLVAEDLEDAARQLRFRLND